jgi:hypothetical protein
MTAGLFFRKTESRQVFSYSNSGRATYGRSLVALLSDRVHSFDTTDALLRYTCVFEKGRTTSKARPRSGGQQYPGVEAGIGLEIQNPNQK